MTTAAITIASATAKYAPYTVTVESILSDLDGFDAQDCVFEWDFGDPTPSNSSGHPDEVWSLTNYRAKTKYSDPNFSTALAEISRVLSRDISSNSAQTGPVAAYTYYEAGTFTVTLTVRTPIGSDTTTANVTVSAASVGNGWQTVTVNNIGGGDFVSLTAAIAYVNGTLGGKGRIQITSGQVFTLSSMTRISVDNVILTTSGDTKATIIPDPAIVSARNPTPILNIDSGVKNVYIENLYFQQISVPIQIVTSIAISTSGTGCTVHNCNFSSFYTAIRSASGSLSTYINQCEVDFTRSHSFISDSGPIVISGNLLYANNDQTASLTGYQICIGSEAIVGLSAIQWNDLRYNGVFESDPATDDYPPEIVNTTNTNKGPIYISQCLYSHIYGNYCFKGTNTIGSNGGIVTNVRWEANVMLNGGSNAILDICYSVSFLNVLNCVFRLKPMLASSLSVATYGYGTGDVTSIKWYHNTFVIQDNYWNSTAICNFNANGRTFDDIRFRNNAFIDHRLFAGRYLSFADADSITSISNNLYPTRRDEVAVAQIDGTDYSWTEWHLSNFTSNDVREIIFTDTMHATLNYTIDKTEFVSVQNGILISDTYLKDIRGSSRISIPSTIGARESPADPFPDDTGESFSCTFVPVIRTNRVDLSLSGDIDGYNGYITVVDNKNGFTLMGGAGAGSSFPIFRENDIWGPATKTESGIKTEIEFETVSNGFDLHIIYTSDGTGGQTTNRGIGAIYLNSWQLGKIARGVQNRDTTFWQEFNNWTGTLFNNMLSDYPNFAFSPTITFGNADYSITMSIQANFAERSIAFFQEFSSYTGISKAWEPAAIWTTGFNGSIPPYRLPAGETFEVTVSVRITRDIKNWLTTVQPYKDYFQSRYGTSVQYARDPRPIQGMLPCDPSQSSVDNHFMFLTYNYTDSQGHLVKVRRQDHYGWQTWYDRVMKFHNNNGFDRVLMWSISGCYLNNIGLNFPTLMTTPFLTPSAAQWNEIIDPLNHLTDTRGNVITYPEDVPDNTSRPMIDTLSYLIRLGFEIPSIGYYFGRVTSVDSLPWDSGITRALNRNNAIDAQSIFDEFDIGAHYLKSGWIGLDVFSYGNSPDDLSFLSDFYDRYPSLGPPVAEASPSDIIVSKTSQTIASTTFPTEWVSTPHVLAEFLTPGHETILPSRFDIVFRQRMHTNDFSQDQLLMGLENMAQLGYVMLVFEDVYLDDISRYMARDLRFNYNETIDDYPTLSAPINLQRIFHNSEINQTYEIRDKHIRITWDANTEPDFDHYVVYKAKVFNGNSDPNIYVIRAYVKTSIYYDLAVEEGKTYYYKIKSVDVFGNESSFSEIISFEFIADDPNLAAPSDVRRDTSGGLNTLVVTWNE